MGTTPAGQKGNQAVKAENSKHWSGEIRNWEPAGSVILTPDKRATTILKNVAEPDAIT